MKKLITCVMLLMLFSLSAMQWRFDDFESGTFGDITTHDHDGDGQNWEVAATVKRKAGIYVARSASAGLTPDNQMDFPGVYVEADSTYFAFWVGAESATNFAEHYQVLLDFNGPCMPDQSQIVWEETLTSSDWKYVKINLTPYIRAAYPEAWDATVYISIRHYDSANQSALLIDDVKYLSHTLNWRDGYLDDIAEGVVAPYENVYTRMALYDYSVWDASYNFIGFTSCELHYVITDDTGEHPEQSIIMTPYDSSTDEFYGTYYTTIPGNPMGSYMEYWAVTTDMYGIVTVTESFFLEWGEINFEEGFEDIANFDPATNLPVGWVTYQTGDDQGNSWDKPWEVDTPGQNVNTGLYSITSAAQTNFGVWLTDDYLVSPRIRINAPETYLKYFVNAQTSAGERYRERWSLLISTVDGPGTDIENFELVYKDSIIPTADNHYTWYEKVVDLSPYENQQVRIMWIRHYTSTEEKLDRYLNIDDISVAEMPVITVQDPGNAEIPGVDVVVTATATDYSGINNVTLYYTIDGGLEMSVVMTDNGDDTFTGSIPGQPYGSKCSWYCIVTDGSPFGNTVTTDSYDVIWFDEGILEWGSTYSDAPWPLNSGSKAGMDWNFGTKGNLYLNEIEIGLDRNFSGLKWKLVEFDGGQPTENVIGDLSGTWDYTTDKRTLRLDGNSTPIYGHVALVFEFDKTCEIMLDESGNNNHAWEWNSVSGWSTNSWGAFYIKMYISQSGIEDEFVASQSELFQNYPNPFNPVTSISFYNSVAGDVNLSIYNVKGEMVVNLLDQRMETGLNKVDFNASMLNSGVYYYTLKTPEATMTKKMVLIK